MEEKLPTIFNVIVKFDLSGLNKKWKTVHLEAILLITVILYDLTMCVFLTGLLLLPPVGQI